MHYDSEPNDFRIGYVGRRRRSPRRRSWRMWRHALSGDWGLWWLKSSRPQLIQQHCLQTAQVIQFIHQSEMLDRPDGHFHWTSAFLPQGTLAGQLVMLLIPLDDLLQLSSLQHMRNNVAVIKVNHWMLRKKRQEKNV